MQCTGSKKMLLLKCNITLRLEIWLSGKRICSSPKGSELGFWYQGQTAYIPNSSSRVPMSLWSQRVFAFTCIYTHVGIHLHIIKNKSYIYIKN